MARKMTVLSSDDVKNLRNAYKVLKKISTRAEKLKKLRKEADEAPDRDGAKWQKATEQFYGLFDDMESCHVVCDSHISRESIALKLES